MTSDELTGRIRAVPFRPFVILEGPPPVARRHEVDDPRFISHRPGSKLAAFAAADKKVVVIDLVFSRLE